MLCSSRQAASSDRSWYEPRARAKVDKMNTTTWPATAAVILALALALAASEGRASALFGWEVTDVPAADLLNVRAYPSNASRVLVGYPNGTPLSLTGRCTGLNLNGINGRPSWQQRQAVGGRWCEVWLDPRGSGAFQAGWVHGRYIRPL